MTATAAHATTPPPAAEERATPVRVMRIEATVFDAIEELAKQGARQYEVLSQDVSAVRRLQRASDETNTRRHAQVMTAVSTVLARVDKLEADEPAVRAAVDEVHRVAHLARADVDALGSQVGKTTAELEAEAGAARAQLVTLHEHDGHQAAAIAEAERLARRAHILSIVRIPALMAAGAAIVKLYDILAPYLPHLH